jgi:predicted aconitase with swiveling domain
MDHQIILKSHPGVGSVAEGEALVSHHGFSARYDLNRDTGVVSRETHDLYGQSIVDRICLFETAKGGVATAWALYDMKIRGVAPRALLFRVTNPIMVQGAVLAQIALMDRLEPDPFSVIETGDHVRVDPAAGTVTVTKRSTGEPV